MIPRWRGCLTGPGEYRIVVSIDEDGDPIDLAGVEGETRVCVGRMLADETFGAIGSRSQVRCMLRL